MIYEPQNGLERNTKHQTPSSKEVRNLKHQTPKTDAGHPGSEAVLNLASRRNLCNIRGIIRTFLKKALYAFDGIGDALEVLTVIVFVSVGSTFAGGLVQFDSSGNRPTACSFR